MYYLVPLYSTIGLVSYPNEDSTLNSSKGN